MAFLLDTDVFIDILRKRPAAEDWLASLPDLPALSGVAALEASFGARSASALRDVLALRSMFRVIWPEALDLQRSVEQFATLRRAICVIALNAWHRPAGCRHRFHGIALRADSGDIQCQALPGGPRLGDYAAL